MNDARLNTVMTDRLGAASALIRWGGGLWVAGVAVASFGGLVQAALSDDPRPALQVHLPSERLAIEPAGRIGRVPASHPSIVPHFGPGLAPLAPDLDRLVIAAP